MTSDEYAEAAVDAAAQFSSFVNSRGPALQRTAYLLTGDWALAEDLLQTALAKSYLAWNRIRHDDPEGYVRKVLANTQATWWRRKWRGETPTAELPDRTLHVQGADDRMALADALARLPRRQRAVIVLRFHEDLTETAVASALGISVGTVKSQCAKALARLREDPALRPENGS
jgi:RNA polymerase sigma-70 factor (sigma-E family)